MTIIDILIVIVPLYLFFLFKKHHQELKNLGLTLSTNFILFGLFVISIFYATDLAVMHLLPLFKSNQSVMAAMLDLHLNWNRMVTVLGIGTIGFGVAYLLHVLIPSANRTMNKLEKNIVESEEKFRNMFQKANETRQLSERLIYHTRYDVLTNLINRREFERRLTHFVETTCDNSSEHALCYLDLDQFKVINDTCGHVAGDEMLRQIGKLLQKTIRKRDTLARLGGDEFGIIIQDCNLEQARQVASTLQKKIQDFRFVWDNKNYNIGISMGIVPINENTGSTTDILKDADVACIIAKDNGRNRIHVYHPGNEELVQRHGEMQWVARINQALEEDRFRLYTQPIVPLGDDDTILPHFEFLVRIEEKDGEIILPGAFLPAAERYNLMTKIDRWVVEKAFDTFMAYPSIVSQFDHCSINISGQSLTEPEFLDFIITQLQEKNIDAERICFEITETAAIENLNAASRFISTLKRLGCRFALDDFGSGLSSFAYLKNMEVDYLKIDGMFVKDIVDNEIDYAMVKMINELGHVMGMQTIAEFVENDAIVDKLKQIGVNYAQGYGIGRPCPIEDMCILPRSDTLGYSYKRTIIA